MMFYHFKLVNKCLFDLATMIIIYVNRTNILVDI